jgi:AcrR family transcriptional regulator
VPAGAEAFRICDDACNPDDERDLIVARRRLTRAESQAQTRTEVLAAAARVFARRGYEGASVGEIAEEAGYSHGAVYSNFADKEDLFLALYEQWVAERVAELNAERVEASTAGESARALVAAWLRRLAADPDAFLLRLEFTARAARDPELRAKLGARVGAVPLAIERLNERAGDGAGLEFSLPAGDVALALQALSLGLALEALANPGAVRPEVGGELAARLLDALTVHGRSAAS